MAPQYPSHRAGPFNHPHSYRNDPVRRAYLGQKYGAKNRKIEFHFSFEEWVKWWEAKLGPNWFKMRGIKRGMYVMARKGDVGPYHPDNVECITHQQNSLDAGKRGLNSSCGNLQDTAWLRSHRRRS